MVRGMARRLMTILVVSGVDRSREHDRRPALSTRRCSHPSMSGDTLSRAPQSGRWWLADARKSTRTQIQWCGDDRFLVPSVAVLVVVVVVLGVPVAIVDVVEVV